MVAVLAAVTLIPLGLLAWLFSYEIEGRYHIWRMCSFADEPGGRQSPRIHSRGLNTFTDEMPSSAIKSLYWASVERITRATGAKPVVYTYDDITVTWPRLKAVWQRDHHYLAVSVAMGNDADSIRWLAVCGRYDPRSEHAPAQIVRTEQYDLPLRE